VELFGGSLIKMSQNSWPKGGQPGDFVGWVALTAKALWALIEQPNKCAKL